MKETGPELAQVIVAGVHQELLKVMQSNVWPVAFSISVVNCIGAPQSGHELIKMSDDLMCAVKNIRKNGVTYAIYPDQR